MSRLILYVFLIMVSIIVTSIGITLGYDPFTNLLLNMAIGAILGFIKGRFFYET